MRRFVSLAIAIAILLGLGMALAPLTPATASPSAVVPQQRGAESPCIPEQNKIAYPNVLLLGEETNITLTVRALCASESFPLHIVLVMDDSGSMAGQKINDLKKAIKQLINDMHFDQYPQVQMGIVKFTTVATTLCRLTNNAGQLRSCANKFNANGGTAIDAGIREGLRVLMQGRARGAEYGEIREVMVVLSDGGNNAGCDPVLKAASQAKGQKVLMMTVCVGSDCDAACLRQAASSARYFFQIENSSGLVQAFAKIRDEVLNVNLKRLTVTDLLPPNMQYVADTAQPEPDRGDPTTGMTWIANYVPKDGITLTYRVRPLETGYYPTNVEASGELIDSQSRTKGFTFPVPFVTILQPFPLATVTAPPPTPTLTPTPTGLPPTPTPTDTPTPTPTPTRVPGPIYLPILLKEHCDRTYIFADVVLVLDISTSMDRPTSAGRSKLAASVAAAKDFVAVVDLTPDEANRYSQVGVVGFNRSAWTELPLSNNRNAIDGALDSLVKRRAEYTRLDLGFQQGETTVLGAGHKAENTPVIILLTDGLPNRIPPAEDGKMETTVLRAAQHAKDNGVRIFTIGIGAETDIDPVLLAGCATSPEDYFYEADAEDLERVYNEIAYSFGCPDRHDWSQPWE